ncbi:hypothetical protein NPIL_541681 [Nephila pilipes]|uniref:Uncharacterized protein n=1 Tax=Nephila pilipes TaxID=299642 RepID=A0A8X6UAY1_NEPPI|nr:hypothetical protein NPIL_541681 [Nephila pilipes]
MKGTFKHDLVIGEDHYSLTWHVVRTKHLSFEAITGTDILEQASLMFTEEGVEFHKYEGKNYQDQKESIHPEARGSIQEIKSENLRTACITHLLNGILQVGYPKIDAEAK